MVDDSGCEVSPLHVRRWEAVEQNSTTSSDEQASTQENVVAMAMAVPPKIRTNIDSLNTEEAIETRRSSIHDRHEPQSEQHEEGNSNLFSPWGSHDDLIPREPPSWVERATEIVAEQSPGQAFRVFGAIPRVPWQPADPLSKVTPPPGSTPPSAQSPASITEPFPSAITSSPPGQSSPNAPDSWSNPTIDEPTPSPVDTPTPLLPPTCGQGGREGGSRLLAKPHDADLIWTGRISRQPPETPEQWKGQGCLACT
jgi:hypothetical protein